MKNPESLFWRVLIMTRSTPRTPSHSAVTSTFPRDGSSSGTKTPPGLLSQRAITPWPPLWQETRVHISAKLKEEAARSLSWLTVCLSSSMSMVRLCVYLTLLYSLYMYVQVVIISVITGYLQSAPWLAWTCWPAGPRSFLQTAWCCSVTWNPSKSGTTPGH